MRTAALAVTLLCAASAYGCTFSPHPPSGAQKCSSDNPPQCPDGYACVAGYCYDNGHLPAADASVDADAAVCTPVAIKCGTGSGKRCETISEQCNQTIDCGACTAAGESCGTTHTCSVACGQAGHPCCVGSTCTASDTVCANGLCTTCGGANQLCCTNGACSALGATCAVPAAMDAGTACLLACATTTGACVSGTDLDCTIPCGPGKIGKRTCTCASEVWKLLACSYPAGADYSCYRLPATVPLCEATTTPALGASCSVADCSPCGSTVGKGFVDATGVTRAGYCVCTNSQWNCAMTKDWPCPGNSGC